MLCYTTAQGKSTIILDNTENRDAEYLCFLVSCMILYKVASVLNKSDMHSSSMVAKVKSIFQENFSAETKGTKGTLTAEVCIWEVQKVYTGKAMDTLCRWPGSAGRHGG